MVLPSIFVRLRVRLPAVHPAVVQSMEKVAPFWKQPEECNTCDVREKGKNARMVKSKKTGKEALISFPVSKTIPVLKRAQNAGITDVFKIGFPISRPVGNGHVSRSLLIGVGKYTHLDLRLRPRMIMSCKCFRCHFRQIADHCFTTSPESGVKLWLQSRV